MAEVQERLEGSKFFAGPVTFGYSVQLPTGVRASVGDGEVKEGAKISASKLRRRLHLRMRQGNVAAVAETGVLHTGYGVDGEVKAIRVSVINKATGDSTVTIDIKKNGVTILTGTITIDLNNPNANYGTKLGSVVVAPGNSYVANDVFTYHITVAAGTGTLPTGLSVEMIADEDPQ
jgi:hypothetical protein